MSAIFYVFLKGDRPLSAQGGNRKLFPTWVQSRRAAYGRQRNKADINMEVAQGLPRLSTAGPSPAGPSPFGKVVPHAGMPADYADAVLTVRSWQG